jgi:alkanesulfonate monooxygenase SsuD/methylene tetrahydromethanopterin reductase-like flavin-dependent oxidoreductase (luciferase family)
MDVAVRHFDGVFLMPFLTKDAVQETIRFRYEAAERHGRDPREVRIVHEVVTAPDFDDQKVHEVVGARAVTYLQVPGFWGCSDVSVEASVEPYLLACSALSVVGHSWPRTTIFELLADWLRTAQDQQAHGDNPATRPGN